MEKPILFNTEMVRAILDGRKTVTRRVIKPQPECVRGCDDRKMYGAYESVDAGRTPYMFNAYRKPQYSKGDVLWVRESFRLVDFEYIDGDWNASVQYRADESIGPRLHHLKYGADERIGWRPSIHMPRVAARIFLRVIREHPERLKEMTNISAMEEGFEDWNDAKRVWNSTIEPRDLPLYGWDANPWVWVIEFERIDRKEKGTSK